jgi:hypothetical protein
VRGLSRRRLSIGGGAALFVLAGCGGEDDGGAPAGAGGGGPWEFTDDRGKEATRDSRPTKVVAQLGAAATLWDFGIRPVGTWGEAKGNDVFKGNVNFVQPTVPANEPHWEVLSCEQAGKYPIDVLLYDSRNPSHFTTDLSRYPTVANLPAVKANQAVAWNPETPSTWTAFGKALRDLTGKLSTFKTVA